MLGTAAATPSSIEARFLRVVRTLTEAMLEDLEGAIYIYIIIHIYIWMIDLALKDGDFPYRYVSFPGMLEDFGGSLPDGKHTKIDGTSPLFVGKSTINGPCSMAMLVYRRVSRKTWQKPWNSGFIW